MQINLNALQFQESLSREAFFLFFGRVFTLLVEHNFQMKGAQKIL